MRYRFVFSLIFFAALALYASCKKIDTTIVGVELIPAVDNVTTFDTVFDVITNNEILYDTTRIRRDEEHALGSISNDPDFGKTLAEIYFQLTPPFFGSNPFTKRDSSVVFDSVVLALSFSRIYGDTNSIQQFNVYEINPAAAFDQNFTGYLVDTAGFECKNNLLGTKLVDFRTLDDSVADIRKRDTTRLKNQLRIQLDKSLGPRFLAYDTTTAYKSDSAFRTYFRGFALKVDEAASPAQRALAYFSLGNANTKLIFYYHTSNSGIITDTLAQEFSFSSSNFCNANIIKRTPSGNFLTYLNNGNPSDDRIYLQASPGSMATIRIPGLRNFSNRIIHRAELVFEIVDNVPEPVYTLPQQLFLDADDTANKRILAIPYDFSYQDNFLEIVGGNARNNKYAFNITRYLQGVITRKDPDFTLRLSAPFRTNAGELRNGSLIVPAPPAAKSGFSINTIIAAGRVVLSGGNYPDAAKRARLRIIYSKI